MPSAPLALRTTHHHLPPPAHHHRWQHARTYTAALYHRHTALPTPTAPTCSPPWQIAAFATVIDFWWWWWDGNDRPGDGRLPHTDLVDGDRVMERCGRTVSRIVHATHALAPAVLLPRARGCNTLLDVDNTRASRRCALLLPRLHMTPHRLLPHHLPPPPPRWADGMTHLLLPLRGRARYLLPGASLPRHLPPFALHLPPLPPPHSARFHHTPRQKKFRLYGAAATGWRFAMRGSVGRFV